MKQTVKRNKWISVTLAAALAVGSIPPAAVSAAPESVAGGYEIDMDELPKVHFGKHENWERLYQRAWESHKSNIRKINPNLNPEATKDGDAWYVDEAFDGTIFQWDTLYMMLFDKYGSHEFPTLNSMDNFYVNQVDSEGDDDGYICRRISESSGQNSYGNYMTVDAINPPLFGWAEWEQYKIHGDISRFTKEIKGKTILERLDSYFQFIKRTRTHKDGPWAGLYVSNGQGNGLDNTPNQDWGGWGQAANDMSIQQVQAADYIRMIAEEVVAKDAGLTAEEKAEYTALAEKYEKEEAELKALVQEKMWSEEDAFYYNLDSAGNFTNIATPTGLWSLAAGIPTEDQAQRMIENFTQNSEKMFRPNGLSTVCYDYQTFKPTGGYWNGAMWSPTSYQWIKGLQEYGYNELAFREAVRHINALADVCDQGAYDRYGAFLNTLWENYSSEYTKPGSTENNDKEPSRSNFVGWTGALAIGSMIEDVLGITIDAVDNTVNWDIHLSEEQGISDLYMNSPESGENRISLKAAERVSADSAIALEVTCDKAFTLHVKNGETEKSFDVEAGTHTYQMEGTDGNAPYMDAAIRNFAFSGLTADAFADARDYVYFTEEENAAITDGLKNQAGGEEDFIYNVNTVGSRAESKTNPLTYRADEELQALSLEGAADCVRGTYALGNDGFMFMVPADNELRTVKAIVGIQNAEAEIRTQISDASSENVVQTIRGGKEEETYVVEIPYRAASDDESLLVEYIITSGDGNITLKGILAEDGGAELTMTPENLTVESQDEALKVSADVPEGIEYDSYRVYVSLAGKTKVYETNALPYTVAELENYSRYSVQITGIRDGVESSLSEAVEQTPEKEPRPDRIRAYRDWEAALSLILNGNADAQHIKKKLNFDVIAPIYGSHITVSSNTAGAEYGIMADGSVASPVQPMKDQEVILTGHVTLGETTITVQKKVIVSAKSKEEIPYVFGVKADQTSGEVNLTQDGSKDWVQFAGASIDERAEKAGASYITDIQVKGASGRATDAPFRFTATDAESMQPRNNAAVLAKGKENGFTFRLPYSEKMQHAKVYACTWGGDVTVELVVNGVVRYSGTFGKDTSNGMVGQCFDLSYRVPEPDDVVTARVYCSKDLGEWGGCSVGLQAITLQETEEKIPDIEIPGESRIRVIMNQQPAVVDLTEEGAADWVIFNNTDAAKLERKNTESKIQNIQPLNVITKIGTNASDADFSYSDGKENAQGTYNKSAVFEGMNNGITFTVPYGAQKTYLTMYFGAWSAKAEIKAEILKGDETVEEKTVEFDTGEQASGTPAQYRMLEMLYGGSEDGDSLRITMKNVTLYDARYGNTCIGAVTLKEVYQVRAKQPEHGSIGVNSLEAAPGKTVELFVSPDDGYVLKEGSLKYTADAGESCTITEDTLIMPEGNVTVEAKFESIQEQEIVQEIAEVKKAAAKTQETADNAATAAQEAKDAADAAKVALDSAKKALEEAIAKNADDIKDIEAKVKTAQDAADQASQDAAAAATAAENAQSKAEEAYQLAEEAKNGAEGSAEKAKEAAAEAQGYADAAAGHRDAAKAQAELADAAKAAAEAAAERAEAAAKRAEEAQKAVEEAEKRMLEAQKRVEELEKKYESFLANATFKAIQMNAPKAKSAKKKTAKITWKAVEGAEGYEIQYAAKANFKGAKSVSVKSASTVSRTLKKLKSRKAYYVRVRAYRTVDGQKIYTGMSPKKKVRIK